ncbi:hypothetical protein KBC99_00165 [Candidatus Saccharibacteria bacterium]|nr:hypothetical protein [Candidatus Saccharibacteria bacterium]
MYFPELKSVSAICRSAVFNCEIDLGGRVMTGQQVLLLMKKIAPFSHRQVPFYNGKDVFVLVYTPDRTIRDGCNMVFLVRDRFSLTSLIDLEEEHYSQLHVCDAAQIMTSRNNALHHDRVIGAGKRFSELVNRSLDQVLMPEVAPESHVEAETLACVERPALSLVPH